MSINSSAGTDEVPVFVCAPERRKFVLIAAILASSMGFIDGTVVTIAMPAMRATLDAGLFQAQWISNSYMLFLSALILLGGALGDRFGMARVFRTGIFLFIVASLLCAVAPNAELLIIARAFQGFGAAFMIPGSLALVSRTYPEDERGAAIGTWAAASALTTALGPIIAGLVLSFGDDSLWRWIFAINLPFGLLALWFLWRGIEHDPRRSEARVDIPGAVTATVGLGALAWGMTRLEGDVTSALPLLALGAVSLVAFVAVEAGSRKPMLPLDLFGSRMFSMANLATFFLYGSLSIIMFFLPMTVIAGWGILEIEAAAAFAPLSVFITLLSAPVGRLSDRVEPRYIIAFGAALVCLGYTGVGLTAGAMKFWLYTLPSMSVVGLGMAFVVAPLSTAVMKAAPQDLAGAASGVNNAVSRMAGLIGVAVAGYLAATFYAGTLSFAAPGMDADHVAATNAAFARLAYVSATLAAAACLVSAWGVRRRKR